MSTPSSSAICSASAFIIPPKSLAHRRGLNPAFTRFVNDRLTVQGATGLARPDGGASRENRLRPVLDVEHEREQGRKTALRQHFTAIREDSPRECLHAGIRFC